MDNKKLIKFLIITFASSWIIQIIGSLSKNGYVYTVCLGLICVVPLISTGITAGGLTTKKSGIGWSFDLGKNWKWFLAAWVLSAILIAICTVVYFLIFPSKFDLDCGYYQSFFAEDSDLRNIMALDFVLIEMLTSWFFGAFLNMFFFIGQEVGFRACLVPLLTEKFGCFKKAVVVSGLLFGAYRFPIIALAGYQYGDKYFLSPVSGLVVSLIYGVAISIFLYFIYSKSRSVWLSSLAVGTVNALAPCAMYFLNKEPSDTLLGPTIYGLIPSLVLLSLSVLLLFFVKFEPKNEEENKKYQSPFGRLR